MAEGQGFGDRWREYRASKATLFWSCVASVILTMIVGFSWGGWVTGGTATEVAEEAAEQGRAKLAATVCVERFLAAPDAGAQLASLKDTSTWQRDDFVEEGGWVTLAGFEDPVAEAAELCAERLADVELPAAKPMQEASTSEGSSIAIQ